MAHTRNVNIIKLTDHERFITFTLSVIQELEDEGRFGTAHVYRSMLRAFQRYWESQHTPKTEIRMRKVFDVATIQKFERHLLERMLS